MTKLLKSLQIPEDFAIPNAGDLYSIDGKSLADEPDDYWDVNLIEDYMEVPVDERMNLGSVPIYHKLNWVDAGNCPICGTVTMFRFYDIDGKPYTHRMECTGTWDRSIPGCGFAFFMDCTPYDLDSSLEVYRQTLNGIYFANALQQWNETHG